MKFYQKSRDTHKEYIRDIEFIKEIEQRLESYLNKNDVTQSDMIQTMLSDWRGELEIDIKSIEPKRKPNADGVLPLTESELREFAIINKTTPNVTLYLSGGQIYCKYNGDFDFSVYRYKTILWLAERFNLTEG